MCDALDSLGGSVRFARVVVSLAVTAILVVGVVDAAASLAFAEPPADASLHGTVLVRSGVPLTQVSVTVEGSGGGQAATTNERGQYTMNGLTPGRYRVTFSAPGFDSYQVDVSLPAGANQEIDAVLFVSPVQAEPAPTVEGPN